jgi:hypothetical protein
MNRPGLPVRARLLPNGGLVQQFDRAGFRSFLTLANLHPHPLTFRQLTQPAPTQSRGMNEDVLPPRSAATIPNPFSTLYHSARAGKKASGPAATVTNPRPLSA